MKKTFTRQLLACSLFVLLCASQAAIAGPGYKINVRIKGIKDTICLLANYYGDKQYIKDTAKVDGNGRMVFQGKKTLEGGIYLVVLPSKNYFEIIIDKAQTFSIETDTLNFVTNMKVKDSEDNTLFYGYLNFIEKKAKEGTPYRKALENKQLSKDTAVAIRKKAAAIDKEVKDFRDSFIKEHPQNLLASIFKSMDEPEIPEAPTLSNGRKDSTFAYYYYKNHYWDNINFADDRIIRTPIYHGKLDNYFKNIVTQIPDSINKDVDYIVEKTRASRELYKYTLWYLTYNYESASIMGMDEVFVHIIDKYYTNDTKVDWYDSTTIFKIKDKARAIKPLLIGKKAQPIILKDSLGNYHSLYDVKHKYTILVFWDPDCGHCQKSMPVIKHVYDSLKTDKTYDIETFAVDGTTEEEKWRKYVREKKLNWINVADIKYENNFRYEWDLKSYPQIFILNEKKEIIAKKLAPEQIADFIRRYDNVQKRLKEKSKS